MTHTSQPIAPRRSHWLCIAYAFPPINRSGTHRTRAFVTHLDKLGWDSTILTVEPFGEPLDRSLMEQVPSSASILRAPCTDLIAQVKKVCRVGSTKACPSQSHVMGDSGSQSATSDNEAPRTLLCTVKEFASRLLITPDSRIGWIRPAVRMGMQSIRQRRPDVLYSTSPCVSAHLIGLILSRRTGLPWVADFRDPWRDSPFRESTFAMLERWDDWLEQKVLRRASHVVCNTPTMAERLCKRLPFVADKCSTILNGFDAERPYAAESWRTAPSETFVLTHAGQFYGPRSPKPVFKALRSLLKRRPALRGKLQLLLIGPRLFDGTDLAQMAKEAGVDEHVHVLGQKSHAETMSRLAGSDALLLAGTSGVGSELQVPNKLFEYLTLRKPIIATLASGNPAIDILKDARAEALVCDPNDTVALASAITQLATGKHPDVADAWSGVAQFDRTHRAEELADVFRMVSENESHRTAQTTLPSPLRTQSQLLEHA